MTPEEFSQWGLVFALSAAAAALALGLIVFYSMLQDKKAGIPVIIAFALAGIGKAAKYYLLSSIAVVLMLPMIAYYSWKNWKKPMIWINWIVFVIASPIAFYAYQTLYAG
ncbi:hypothetical protein [Pleionea litopenaei]|uniref:Uncharacterized protein n=1 Tax=Pleionea litopenaei TaxID=3070815 RepID=A0AA51RQU2_9GAMM|nr:hypothetical protein [Pleionea sp. HL-JVS1]WMS85968.1 hypothetical protein Q9312_12145 [Pleionea sp. HL-JVS1]